uniref:Uncharacterized protein n=2 Tax=Oryza TaxID=4527 RepID=A0A0E0NNW2_ORYRU
MPPAYNSAARRSSTGSRRVRPDARRHELVQFVKIAVKSDPAINSYGPDSMSGRENLLNPTVMRGLPAA